MRIRLGLSALLLALVSASAARAAGTAPTANAGPDATVTTVEVQRERPMREALSTLRFLRANRDFIRSRFDRLRSESRVARAGAGDVDPRFLAYRRLLAEIAAGKDSVNVASDARERQTLFTSVEELAKLERELDMMERLLDAQRTRLAALQADFAGRQRTELDLVLTGGALAGRVDSVRVTLEDGTSVASSLTETQRGSLLHGGALEVFRGLVEPREQVIEIALMGEGWSATGHGFVTLEPARDRLTFLKLDLTQASPKLGIGSLAASTWLLETSPAAGRGASPAANGPQAEANRDRP
jgi:hypothetical protein